jgi:prepilin-type N-terminal cleavage/methylation domain-containing protein
MTTNRRTRQKGFTLIELLIVVAIIGIIAAILIPNFLDALQRGRQKRTMGDFREFGTAVASFYTDNAGAGAAGADITWADYAGTTCNAGEATVAELETALIPGYIQQIPLRDGWGHNLDGLDGLSICLVNPPRSFYLGMRSPGRHGTMDGATYTPGNFDPTDYDQDIVFTDGGFSRAPRGYQQT